MAPDGPGPAAGPVRWFGELAAPGGELGPGDLVDALADPGCDAVDLGWFTDEELVIAGVGRDAADPRVLPVLTTLDDAGRAAALDAAERLLVTRGELVLGPDGTLEPRGRLAAVAALAARVDTSGHVHHEGPDGGLDLLVYQIGGLCLLHEPHDGGHRLTACTQRHTTEVITALATAAATGEPDAPTVEVVGRGDGDTALFTAFTEAHGRAVASTTMVLTELAALDTGRDPAGPPWPAGDPDVAREALEACSDVLVVLTEPAGDDAAGEEPVAGLTVMVSLRGRRVLLRCGTAAVPHLVRRLVRPGD